MSQIKPRPLPAFGQPEHFKATHEVGYDRGVWMPVMRVGKHWVNEDGTMRFHVNQFTLVRKLRKASPSAPQPRQRAAAPRTAPLRRVGEGKRAWQALYKPWLAFLIGIDPICRRCRWISRGDPSGAHFWNHATEGHHPFGQLGALILVVLPFCRQCHDDVHFKNPKQAHEDGWLRDLD